ncbi:nonstructural protein 2 [Duck-associated ambidensovirus 1]|uniref:Nonstructural protein 2 n=1 Tax=Duck-associated ambidensovirus 1 TaxID=2810799 RepID=A0A891F091_9VIRU|nr:nonstructural protein 2 [Duck-associated ambidensovirus 1]QRK03667.1 nonstructural protein 2 [Duck-associated ambidensovirus 1]QRK03675.1 nonstructural protein 2 [Duck-associated ambidensovirus 1]
MSTLKSYFEQVATAFQNQPALWTPGWWYLTINNAILLAKEESSAMDMFHYENLKILIHKISRAWSNCSSRSEITSLESLLQKIGHLLVLTFQTSLSSQIIENVMCYISTSLNKENYSVEICSDSALITIMCTLSIPAPLVVPSVSAVGEKRSHAATSDQDTDTGASSDSGDDETFSVQSYISSSVKGVAKNRGLKEDVKDWRIILKVYNGKKWKKKSGTCWDHWKTRLDMTYEEASPMKSLVDQLVASANVEMDTKKWKKIKKEDLQSGNSYRGKYQNYSKRRQYAR